MNPTSPLGVPKWHLIYLAYLFVYFIAVFLFLQQNGKHCLWTPDSRARSEKETVRRRAAFGRDSLNIYGTLSNWRAVAVVVAVYIIVASCWSWPFFYAGHVVGERSSSQIAQWLN